MCYTDCMVEITTIEAANRLGVSRQYINKLLKQGRLPGAYQVGRAWIIPEEALDNIEPRKVGRPRKDNKSINIS
jgi:excisionase family DNA binding protein